MPRRAVPSAEAKELQQLPIPRACRSASWLVRQRLLLLAGLSLSLARAEPPAVHSPPSVSLAQATTPFSVELPHLDSTMVTLMCCLLGVPMVTATVAFLVVEVSMREQQPRTWETAEPGRRGRPLTVLTALLDRPGGVPIAPSQMSARSLPGPRTAVPIGTGYLGVSTMATLTEPPSLPGTSAASPPPFALGGGGSCFDGWGGGSGFGGGNTFAGAAGSSDAQPPEEVTRVSPLSTALLVKNPAGVIVRIDGDLAPHPERKSVNIVSVKDGSAVLVAHLDESTDFGGGKSAASIRVETKAKSIPIAVLDTRRAVFLPDSQPPPFEQRCVVLHRVAGEDGTAVGPACAWIAPASSGRFLVHYLMGEPGAALTVHTTPSSPFGGGGIDYVVDAQAQIVARRETPRSSNGQKLPDALWVRQGVDMALLSCVAIAVEKLKT
mmetsp:Transcript_54251/g.176253  ORF Transcript_54251/g.176253 Transcript_54251/m.176253 type:complete len:437 (-) Transcript_54251:36-1346(-)